MEQEDITSNNENESNSTGLAVVKSVDDLKGQLLQTSQNKETKSLPKWKIKELMDFKDRKLGSLKSQLRFLKSNKCEEFIRLYSDDKEKFRKLVNEEHKSLNSRVDIAIKKIKEQLKLEYIDLVKKSGLKEIKKEVEKDIYFYTQHSSHMIEIFENEINYEDFSNVLKSDFVDFEIYESNKDLNSIIKLKFELLSGKFFKDTEIQIEELETTFEKSLLFNDLGVAYQIYEQLERADNLLEKVSKHETPKEYIDFAIYVVEDNYNKLVQQVEDSKKYEFDN